MYLPGVQQRDLQAVTSFSNLMSFSLGGAGQHEDFDLACLRTLDHLQELSLDDGAFHHLDRLQHLSKLVLSNADADCRGPAAFV